MSDSMEKLSQMYRQTFKTKAEVISKFRNLAQSNNWQTSEPIVELADFIHKLKGSSGAYGYNELYSLAISVDKEIKLVLENPSNKESLEQMQRDLDGLVAYLQTSI